MKASPNTNPVRSRLRANTEPLYCRLPKTDADGRHLGDFMMLIPGLRDLPRARLDARLASLHALIETTDEIVFADLNLPLNLLWVSVRQRNGVITEVATRIRQRFPEALLIGHTALERTPRSYARAILLYVARGFRRLPIPLLAGK